MGDSLGSVMHMLRADAPHFRGFGEVYFSTVAPGAVKAWRRHTRTTQHFTVPVGRILLVVCDDSGAQVEQLVLSRQQHALTVVPTGLWYGFASLSDGESLVTNCIDEPYDPEEIERLDAQSEQLGFDWQAAMSRLAADGAP